MVKTEIMQRLITQGGGGGGLGAIWQEYTGSLCNGGYIRVLEMINTGECLNELAVFITLATSG